MIDWDAAVMAPCMAVFGEAEQPVYTPVGGGGPFPIDGIFDDAYKGLVMGDDGSPEIATISPVIGVRLAQFAVMPTQGDTLTIPRLGRVYMVDNVQPDGKGAAKLTLSRVSP